LIRRGSILLALASIALGAGCQKPCRPGTVFVELTVAASAAGATRLHVTALVGSTTLQSDDLPYHGQSRYGLEVDFPTYSAGQMVTLVVAASNATTTLATATLTTKLAPSCTSATLTLGRATTSPDGGGGGDGGVLQIVCSSDCEQLDAVSPPFANGGATLTLEGTFDAPTVVHFPGGVDADATLLGPHRASVVVPATATTGDLSATTGTKIVGPLHFGRAGFALGLGRFAANYPQNDSARAMPALLTARFGHTASLVGNGVLVAGGSSVAGGLVKTIERATFNADGTLTPFAVAPGAALATPRTRHAAVVIGHSLYVIGGSDGTHALASVEQASFDDAGAVATFFPVPDSALTSARAGAAAVVVGSWLYVLGGSDGSQPLASVERAAINPDGTLSAFAVVDGLTLATARSDHGAVVADGTLFVTGGNGPAALASVEAATIGADGSLGAFAAAGSSLGSARAGHASFVLGGALYVAGGQSGATALTSVERAAVSANGTLGGFAVAGNLARARSAFAAVWRDGFVHAIGGSDGSRELAGVERADLAGGALSAFATSPTHLSTARSSYSATVIGNRLYLAGGYPNNATLGSVESATIAADGSLGATTTAGPTLLAARAEHAAVVTGSTLYLLGGAGPLASVEAATIAADGSLGPFSASSVVLKTPRAGLRAAVVGSSVCAFGGAATGGSLASVECAPIAADGTLGSFDFVTNVNLVNGRRDHSSVVVGDALVALAGVSANGERSDVELAPIGADGALGGFATSAATLLAPENAPATVLVGDSLYVLGGYGTNDGFSNRIGRSAISSAGALGAFGSAGTLGSAASGASAIRLGNFVYLVGGLSSSSLNIVQQASLQ
jgi:Kelch motif